MTAVTFPSSPNNNDVFTASNGSAYLWDGSRWINTGTLDQVVKRDGTEVSLAHSGDDLNINGDTFFVDASTNRISVGHTTPLTALDISGDITVSGTVDSRDIATDGTKLDGIEAAADVTDSTNVVAALTAGSNITIAADGTISSTSVAPTAAEILTAISTVDGVASGLDADLLDGQHGAYYLDYTNLTNVPGGGGTIDADLLDGINSSGFVQTPGSSSTFISSNSGGAVNPNNTTVNGLYYCNSISLFGQTDGALYSQAYSSIWQGQIFQDYRTGQLAIRGKNNGTWQSWRTVWDSSNDGSGSGLDADTVDGIQASSFLRSDADDTATGTLTVRDIKFAAGYHLQRSDHASGHLEGSYNNVGANDQRSNPIYTIGSSYNPGDAALSNMYGIGYTHGNASFISLTGASGWGMYVAADGDARIYFDGSSGTISSTGNHYVGSNTVWHAGNDGSGSGLDADTVDGIQGATILRSGVSNNLNITNLGYYTTGTSGQNQNSGTISYGWGYQTSGAWSHPYPDLIFGYHTGMRFGGHTSYGGCRFYSDHPSRTTTMLLSVGNGNSDVHVNNNLSAGGNITAYSSDRRLKENFKNIESPLEKISKLNGCTFDWIENIEELGFTPDFAYNDIGLIAQEVEAVYPQAVAPAPFDHHVDISAEDPKDRIYKSISGQSFLTVKYEKLVPLLVEAIKELKAEIDILKNQEVI